MAASGGCHLRIDDGKVGEMIMKKIFLDLEMNGVDRQYTEVREVCTREIIEFGAVRGGGESCRFLRFMGSIHFLSFLTRGNVV